MEHVELVPLTAREINALFDAVRHEVKMAEVEVFRRVYGDDERTLPVLRRFLHDVTTCPPEVIAYCQQLLAPKEHKST